jgi:hypothetical protein
MKKICVFIITSMSCILIGSDHKEMSALSNLERQKIITAINGIRFDQGHTYYAEDQRASRAHEGNFDSYVCIRPRKANSRPTYYLVKKSNQPSLQVAEFKTCKVSHSRDLNIDILATALKADNNQDHLLTLLGVTTNIPESAPDCTPSSLNTGKEWFRQSFFTESLK